jgi:branched-chain amino acid transport system substrate-binding protein
MRTRALGFAAAVVVAAGVAAAAFVLARGDGDEPLRVAVIVDCFGFLRGAEGLELAGAELPFLERGAHLRTADPADGVTDADLGDGRRARLLIGCDEGGGFTTLIAETRRLVEEEHADVVVGGTWPGDGIVLGQIARRYPGVAFAAATSGPQAVTLKRRSANVFRLPPSFAQNAAGLGFYAYRRLGWRRAALLVEDDEEGWEEAAAFTAEFCAGGGEVVRKLAFPIAVSPAAARRLAGHVDGVAVFSAGVTDPAVLLPPLRRALGSRRLVVGLGVAADPRSDRLLAGIVSPERVPPPASRRGSFGTRLRAAFPGLPASAGRNAFTVDFDTSVEAVLRAAARGGDLQRAIASVELRLPTGLARVGEDGQGVAPVRIVRGLSGGERVLARSGAVPPLLGGLLARTEPPGRMPPRCRRAVTPPYARRLLTRR